MFFKGLSSLPISSLLEEMRSVRKKKNKIAKEETLYYSDKKLKKIKIDFFLI